jgi:transcriptional regulator with XRE-family HTH domain
MNDITASVGDRVRRAQKLRGMTQPDLARLSGLSVRTIKDVEGDIGNHRGETLHAIAKALQMRTSELTAPGEREHQPVPGEAWEDVRDALYRRTPDPEPCEPATPDGVLAGLADLTPAWRSAEYSRVRLVLPALIRDAMSLDDSEEGRGARSKILAAAAWLLNMTRQFDDAWTAARLALDAAPDLPDTLPAVSMMAWCLLRQGRSAEAGTLAAGWADRVEPRFSRATTGELAGYGKMLLYVANAMTTDNQPGEAQDALSLARAAASRIGRDVPFSVATTARFGPATVMVIAAESAALSWQPDKTLAIAERVRGSLSTIEPAQQLRHRLDVASAHSMRREYGNVVEVMQGLQREAPEWFGSQQHARDILEGILHRRRGPLTEELRELAEAARLPL